MLSARAVALGLVSVPLAVLAALISQPLLLPFIGFVPGVVTGLVARGATRGLVNGLLVGGATVALGWGLLYYFIQSQQTEYVAPGFGMSMVLLAGFVVLLGGEVVLGGLVGGWANRD